MRRQRLVAPQTSPEELLGTFITTTQAERRRREMPMATLIVLVVLCNVLLLILSQSPLVCAVLLMASCGFFYRFRGQKALPRQWFGPVSMEWLKQGASVRNVLDGAPKALLPQVLELGQALEALPLLPEAGQQRGQGFRRANRMIFEVQETLFDTLIRLLSRFTPEELMQLTPQNRDYLARAIHRSADARFLSTIFLTLASIGEDDLIPLAREFTTYHPSEHVREAAQEYLLALGGSP